MDGYRPPKTRGFYFEQISMTWSTTKMLLKDIAIVAATVKGVILSIVILFLLMCCKDKCTNSVNWTEEMQDWN